MLYCSINTCAYIRMMCMKYYDADKKVRDELNKIKKPLRPKINSKAIKRTPKLSKGM